MVEGSARFRAPRVIVVGLLGFGLAHCSGEIAPAPSGGGGSESSNGEPSTAGGSGRGGGSAVGGSGSSSMSTSGSVGNGSGSSPSEPGGECAPGAACTAGSGCATASAVGSGACSESCTCDPTGHLSCTEQCSDASVPTGCTQGAACSPNTGCGMGSTGPDACTTSCSCDATGHLQCVTTCQASDAGCVQTVLCIQGDRWDPTLCECVAGGCVLQAGAPCGDANPCSCAAGLICTGTDMGGTCNPRPVCDPIPCPSGTTFDASLCECVAPACRTAADCNGPLPQLCELCGDGGAGCAHWACLGGACQTAFCD